MKRYVTHEATMAIPESWIDASNVTLSYDHPAGQLKVMVTEIRTDVTGLDEAVELLVAQLQRALPRFEVVARAARALDGVAGIDLTIAYRAGDDAALRRLGACLRPKHLTMVAIQGRAEQRPAIDDLAEIILGQMEWRNAETPS